MSRRVIVSGPPCAGKSTYVAQHAGPGDLILDRDEIARSMGSQGWDHAPDILDAAERQMATSIAALPTDRDAWIIRTLPKGSSLRDMADRIGAEVVLLDVPADEAKARAERDGRPAWTTAAIDRWWATHTDHLDRGTSDRGTPESGSNNMGNTTSTSTGAASAPTPADIANAKADEGANGAATTGANGETRLPDDHPLVTALARQKQENDALKEKARRLDEIEESQKTESEKLAERLAEVKAETEQIPAKVSTALKAHLVKIHEISDEDADLFLTSTDPEVLLKQAERFTARSKSASGVVPTQGTGDPNGSRVSSYELGRERARARYQKN